MKQLRKRVFAVVLAALMLVTAMPGTALYASAETGDVIEQAETGEASGTAIEQAETEDTEKKETDNTEEAETGGSTDKPETGDGDTEEQETIAVKPTQELPADIPKEDIKACICEMPCTEGSINGDCPVCGAEGADFSSCEGEKIENSSGEDAGYDDVDTENTIVDLIAVLPDAVTEDNADEVRAQLDEILALYQELTEEEQEQIDISRCLELQEALEAANAPAPVEEEPDLELFGQEVRSGDSGDGWSYADGVLTLENFHAEDSGEDFIHVTNVDLEFTLHVKGDNSVNVSVFE